MLYVARPRGWRNRTRHPAAELQMTPMIDVVFLLLVFFVCTASFRAVELLLATQVAVSGIVAVELPPATPRDEVVVQVAAVDASQRYRVGNLAVNTLIELRPLLAEVVELDRSLPVIVDCAPQVLLGDAIDVYDLCREVGFAEVQFAAEPK